MSRAASLHPLTAALVCVLAATHTGRVAALVPQGVGNAATSTTPFFDTAGRLERTAAPPDPPAPATFVPIHSGNVLVTPDGASDCGLCAPTFLTEAEAETFLAQDGCVKAWLGSAHAGGLAAGTSPLSSEGEGGEEVEEGAPEPRHFWLLDVSHLTEAPVMPNGGVWTPLRAASGPGTCDVHASHARVVGPELPTALPVCHLAPRASPASIPHLPTLTSQPSPPNPHLPTFTSTSRPIRRRGRGCRDRHLAEPRGG